MTNSVWLIYIWQQEAYSLSISFGAVLWGAANNETINYMFCENKNVLWKKKKKEKKQVVSDHLSTPATFSPKSQISFPETWYVINYNLSTTCSPYSDLFWPHRWLLYWDCTVFRGLLQTYTYIMWKDMYKEKTRTLLFCKIFLTRDHLATKNISKLEEKEKWFLSVCTRRVTKASQYTHALSSFQR